MNFAFNSSASSLETFSLTVFGAPSTNSLASFNPNPVASLTTLITFIFWSPASFNTTLKDVFSAAASPAAAPAAGAAAATADTPNSSSIAFTNSDNYTTVIFLISSIISSLLIL